MRDRPTPHEQRDVAPAGPRPGSHGNGGDPGPACDKQQIARRPMDHEGRAEWAEKIESIPFASRGDPLATGAERFDDELDLPATAVDTVERVRAPQQRIERETSADMHELPGACLASDAGRGDPQHRAELSDLSRRDNASVFDDHSGTPTAKV